MKVPRTLKNAKVVVTGGLGFIGSNLVSSLLKHGSEVTVVDPCISGCGGDPRNLADEIRRVEWLPFDIGHADLFEETIRSAQLVFNVAGEIRHQHSMIDPRRDLDINVRSQLLFLSACTQWNPGVRIIYAGTRQVYGVPKYLPVDEGHPIEPVDFNGVHKQAAASYHLLLSRQGLLDACVLNFSNVYGPRMSLDVPGQGFLGAFVRCLRDGDPLAVFGNGRQIRDPIYVDDAVEAFLLAAMAPRLFSRIYNLGGPAALTLFEMASLASASSGAPAPQMCDFPEEHRQIDIGDYHTDSRKIRADLGWQARVSFEDGIRRTLESYGLATPPVLEWTASGD